MIRSLLNFISWAKKKKWSFRLFFARWWIFKIDQSQLRISNYDVLFPVRLISMEIPLKLTSHGIFALFVLSGSIKKLFSNGCVNIYLVWLNIFFKRICPVEKTFLNWLCQYLSFLNIFFSMDFVRWKSVRLPHRDSLTLTFIKMFFLKHS